MDPNVSLKLSKRADETIWGRAISSIGRVVYSSSFNIYILLIAAKSSGVLKAYKNFININDFKEEAKRDAINEKYKKTYQNYINILEKYITENIYTKMQKNAATIDEQHTMASYYEICKYKNEDQVLFRTKLETLVLNMDWGYVQSTKSELFLDKYKEFYLYNIEELYKAQMRHNSILLANAKEGDRDQYEAVYSLIESYIKEVLPILPETSENNQIIKDYRKYVSTIDTYEKKDFLELRKRLTLLGFSKQLFEFSLPMVAKEQCYKEIIEVARIILTNYYTDAEKFACYEVILDAIEEYVDNILDYKTTWDSEEDKTNYEAFKDKFSILKKLARIDFESYKKQREILFIKYDLMYMKKNNIKLPEVRDYYKERLIIRNAIRMLKGTPKVMCGKWVSKRRLKADDFSKENLEEPKEEGALRIASQDEVEAINNYLLQSNNTQEDVENVDKDTPNPENSEEVKPIFNIARYILGNGKRLKKRKAL